jgi:hypothetical protein
VKDFIGGICRQLNFTRTNYKEINAIFIENLQNSRYHLHLYPRSQVIKEGLENIGKATSDPNYLSVEINKMNHLFVMPPFNNSVYRVLPMDRTCELYEKVIEFSTGIHQTIMDILLLVDTSKYKISYLVCNRAKSYIAFNNGTDAMEVMEILRSLHFAPKFSTCYAKLIYVEGNQSQQQIIPPHQAYNNNLSVSQQQNVTRPFVRANNATRRGNNIRRNNNILRGNNATRPHNMRLHYNVTPQFNHVAIQQNPRHNVSYRRPMRRNLMQQQHNRDNINLGGARFVRVMFPENNIPNQYEMRLVRRF